MKVLNLQCQEQHVFEGWFASEDDYASQLSRGLLTCPMCASPNVSKLPSAPRLNLGHATADPAGAPTQAVKDAAGAPHSPASSALSAGPEGQALQAAWLALARQVVARTEDVGERFAEEARKMHYGETEERGIRGRATPAQTEALLDEGIAVVPLVLPDALKGPLQ